MVDVGKKAPDFSLKTDADDTVSLSDFRGKKVVLYFYPKDNTSGWTREAIDFRDEIDNFTAKGAVVLGVSRDSVKSHEKFKAKHELPFTLLSDRDRTVCDQYGVLKNKMLYGKTVLGLERTTFIIDPDGVITDVWRGVKVDGHIREVLSRL